MGIVHVQCPFEVPWLAVRTQDSSLFRPIDQIVPLSYRFAISIQTLAWLGIGKAFLAWLAARSDAKIYYFYAINEKLLGFRGVFHF